MKCYGLFVSLFVPPRVNGGIVFGFNVLLCDCSFVVLGFVAIDLLRVGFAMANRYYTYFVGFVKWKRE